MGQHTIQAPEPGIYPGVPFADYCRWPLMNQSTLKWGWTSMRHLQAAMSGRLRRDSDAMRFGRAVHLRLLEPEAFAKLLVASPCQAEITSKSSDRYGQACGATAKYYNGREWFCGQHKKGFCRQPSEYVTTEERDRIERLAEEVAQHRTIRLFRESGGVESSFVFRSIGDRLLKGRVDKDIPAPSLKIPPTIPDIKKVPVGRGTNHRFARAIEEYHYDMQAAMYVDGMFACDGILREWVWVVIEDGEPYGVNPIQCDQETMAIGRAKYKYLLRRMLECEASGHWPGYSEDVHYGGLSRSAKSRWRWVLQEG